MTTEELLMEVVRMFREREDYFEDEWRQSAQKGIKNSDALALGKYLAYSTAREMLMVALTDNVEILREYDHFGKKENPTE